MGKRAGSAPARSFLVRGDLLRCVGTGADDLREHGNFVEQAPFAQDLAVLHVEVGRAEDLDRAAGRRAIEWHARIGAVQHPDRGDALPEFAGLANYKVAHLDLAVGEGGKEVDDLLLIGFDRLSAVEPHAVAPDLRVAIIDDAVEPAPVPRSEEHTS